jgi:hypothetical protein
MRGSHVWAGLHFSPAILLSSLINLLFHESHQCLPQYLKEEFYLESTALAPWRSSDPAVMTKLSQNVEPRLEDEDARGFFAWPRRNLATLTKIVRALISSLATFSYLLLSSNALCFLPHTRTFPMWTSCPKLGVSTGPSVSDALALAIHYLFFLLVSRVAK